MKDSAGRIQGTIRVEAAAAALNETAAIYPDACIHDLFEIQVEQTPNAPAILFGRRRLTYRSLNRRANQLARHLRTLGVTRGTLVGVCLERSLDMIVALLGILKAGGAYVPLDPGYPAAHLAFMVGDSRAPVIVTRERFADRFRMQAQLVLLDRHRAILDGLSPNPLIHLTTADDRAYVIYTSGTHRPTERCRRPAPGRRESLRLDVA
jgi:non-ribosomal peptide synthetase component F